MEPKSRVNACNKMMSLCHSTTIIPCLFSLFWIFILLHIQAIPFSPTSWDFIKKSKLIPCPTNYLHHQNQSNDNINLLSNLRESVTFLPLKDLRYAKTAMEGNTWFMSSFNDTYEENESEYLYFPSQASRGRLLCIKGHDSKDGTKNSYALAWSESLPDSAILLQGLTFVSDNYYDYGNLWHGLSAMVPFVGWSMKNGCLKPTRWVLFHWGEVRDRIGLWVKNLMDANFGEAVVEGFGREEPYCFEKAVVMRHNLGSMGKERKLEVSDVLRCKARKFCGLNPVGRGKEVNERGEIVIRLTLLMRKGSRSFKNATAVSNIFARECSKVEGCILKVAQSEDLSFCDQVKLMTNTDIVASPHGAQLTNMLFMDRNSSIMEFFPKGWLEHAGAGQYAYHWMADQSGMRHQGAWWDPHVDKECPSPKENLECFKFYKDGKVSHNETYFADWARKVLNQVRMMKLMQASNNSQRNSNICTC